MSENTLYNNKIELFIITHCHFKILHDTLANIQLTQDATHMGSLQQLYLKQNRFGIGTVLTPTILRLKRLIANYVLDCI